MKSFFKILHLVLLDGFYLIGCYFAWILPYSRHPEKYPLALRYKRTRKLIMRICRHMHINFEVTGMEVLSSSPRCLIVANHQSVLDIVCAVSASEKPVSFIAKKELRKVPFVGRIIHSINGGFLDRKDAKQAVRLFRTITETLKKEDIRYIIYPEGTRCKAGLDKGEMLAYHGGSFKIAYRAKTPLLVLSEFGTFRPIGNTKFQKSYLVQMKFHPLIAREEFASLSTNDLAAKAEEMTRTDLKEVFVPRDDAYYAENLHKKKPAPFPFKEAA